MSKKGAFALFAGLLAGAATGVLFSPTSGKKFRDKLQKEIKKGGYGKDSIYTHFKGLAEEVKNSAEDGIKATGLDKKVKNVANKAKATTKKTMKKVKSTKAKVKKVAKAVKAEIKDDMKKAKKVTKAVKAELKSDVKKIKKVAAKKTTPKKK